MTSKALVLTGAGLNCERESASALEAVGFEAEIVHVIDLLDAPEKLKEKQLILFPGGFSFGDYAGAAFVLAEQLRRIEDELRGFIEQGNLALGICNGCQVLLRLGLFSGSDWGFRANAGGHYECRWVNLKSTKDTAFFKKGEVFPVPVAHGEGLLFGGDASEIALEYVDAKGAVAKGVYPINPNGAELDAAGIEAHDGRVLAMMPHPERGFYNWHRPDFAALKEQYKRAGQEFDPDALAPASLIFRNAFESLNS